jgi:hypothetical protein
VDEKRFYNQLTIHESKFFEDLFITDYFFYTLTKIKSSLENDARTNAFIDATKNYILKKII